MTPGDQRRRLNRPAWTTRRTWAAASMILLAVVVVVLSSSPEKGNAQSAFASRSSAGGHAVTQSKKKCKRVTKVVHGKRKKVLVCKKVSSHPSPTPTSTATPTSPAGGTPPPLTTTPNPVRIEVHADDGRAASATLGSDGGTVQATGADGTRYALTVPKNAIDDGVRITLTPVMSLGHLPLDGMVGAVRLQPEGLQLDAPATLEIDFPAAVPLDRQLSFTSQADGGEWHLYPQAYDQHRAVVQLLHFSEYGVGTGTASSIVAAAQHPPTSWQAQAEQLRAMLSQEREAQLLGQPDPYTAQQLLNQMASVARTEYAQDVAPAITQLQTSDDEATVGAATRTVLAWARQVELMGLDTDEQFKAEFGPKTEGLFDLMATAYARLYKKAEAECGTGPHRLVNAGQLGWFVDIDGARKLMKYERVLQLLSGDSIPRDPLFTTALDHCRPRGFLVPPISLTWRWTLTQGQIDETHTLSGHVCGSDPTPHPWTFHFHRVTLVDGMSGTDDNAADFSMTLSPSLQFLPPPEHNNPVDIGLIFGADFVGGSQAAMKISGDADPQVNLTTHNFQSAYGGATLSPVDYAGSAPVQEDMSCPPLP